MYSYFYGSLLVLVVVLEDPVPVLACTRYVYLVIALVVQLDDRVLAGFFLVLESLGTCYTTGTKICIFSSSCLLLWHRFPFVTPSVCPLVCHRHGFLNSVDSYSSHKCVIRKVFHQLSEKVNWSSWVTPKSPLFVFNGDRVP